MWFLDNFLIVLPVYLLSGLIILIHVEAIYLDVGIDDFGNHSPGNISAACTLTVYYRYFTKHHYYTYELLFPPIYPCLLLFSSWLPILPHPFFATSKHSTRPKDLLLADHSVSAAHTRSAHTRSAHTQFAREKSVEDLVAEVQEVAVAEHSQPVR
jgi:hypothetical protein